jgi:hypothetical protein
MRLSAAHLSRLQPEFAGNELGENTVDYAYVKESEGRRSCDGKECVL